ncbi:helix-turn-helix domain-containing protein [Fusobacterium nucleatum]|uniref:helix-turn-helix domain-containing protein n=1 Tax=Fusobacterium nucleatum TaxID=851 RepID=UPI0030CC45B3
MKSIGERIREKRQNLGYTLEKLANEIGVTPSTILKYENGGINIPSDKIEKLSIALKTTPAYLMGWEDERIFRNQVVHGVDIPAEKKINFIKNIAKKLNEGYSIDEIAKILSFPNIDKFLNDTIFEKDLLEMAKNDTGVFNSLADTVVLLTKQAFKKAGLTFDSEDEEINRETFEDVVNRKNMSEILEREISKYNKREIYDFYINENLAGDIKYKNKKISIIIGDPKDKSTFKELDLNSDENIKLGTVISLIQLALEKVELDNQGYKGLENLISSIVIKNYNEKETQKKKLIRTKRSHSIDNLNKNVTELAALKGMHKK